MAKQYEALDPRALITKNVEMSVAGMGYMDATIRIPSHHFPTRGIRQSTHINTIGGYFDKTISRV